MQSLRKHLADALGVSESIFKADLAAEPKVAPALSESLKAREAYPLRSIRTQNILDRMEASKDFWEIIAKFVDGEISNADLIADLDIEKNHAEQSIDEEDAEFPDYYDGEEHG